MSDKLSLGFSAVFLFLEFMKKYELKTTLQGHSMAVSVVKFDPSGQYIATGSMDTTINLHNQDSQGTHIRSFLGHTNGICDVSWSMDSKFLVKHSACIN